MRFMTDDDSLDLSVGMILLRLVSERRCAIYCSLRKI